LRSDQILTDKAGSGLDVIVDAEPQKSADGIVGVAGKSMAVRGQNKEQIEQELFLG